MIQLVKAFVNPNLDDQLERELDQYCFPNWVSSPYVLHDFLHHIMPSEKYNMEAMADGDQPWEDMHHHLHFLPYEERVENILQNLFYSDTVSQPMYPIMTTSSLSEGNLGNILKTISIDISVKLGLMENT